MKHKTFLPDNKLRPYIQYYWTVNDDGGNHLQLSMADGFTCIRFFRGGKQSFVRNISIDTSSINNTEWKFNVKNNDIQTVSSGILGPRIASYALISHNKIETIGVKFTMLGAQRIFGEKLGSLSNKFTNLSDIKDDGLNTLENSIMNAPSLQKCLSYMDNFFLNLFTSDDRKQNSYVIAEKVLSSSITSTKLADLADVAYCSVRNLNRIIDSYTGLTPKQIIRVARLSTTIKKMVDGAHLEHIDLKQMALECGFYDLSHMTKEMKSLCGYTPLQCISFFRNNLGSNNLWTLQQGETIIWGKIQDSSFRWCYNAYEQQLSL